MAGAGGQRSSRTVGAAAGVASAPRLGEPASPFSAAAVLSISASAATVAGESTAAALCAGAGAGTGAGTGAGAAGDSLNCDAGRDAGHICMRVMTS